MQRGDQWAQTSRVTNNLTGNTTRVTQGSGGGAAVTRSGPGADSAASSRTGSGDVYAGRDGNVYRKQGGGWQKYDNGGWSNVNRPQPTRRARQRARSGASRLEPSTMDQLNRDSQAPAREGAQRTRDYGSYQRSGGGYSGARAPTAAAGAACAAAAARGGGRR